MYIYKRNQAAFIERNDRMCKGIEKAYKRNLQRLEMTPIQKNTTEFIIKKSD